LAKTSFGFHPCCVTACPDSEDTVMPMPAKPINTREECRHIAE
jgi:hypothetical protein